MSKKFKVLSMVVVLMLLASLSIACTGGEEGKVSKGDGAKDEAAAEAPKQDKKELAVGDTYEVSGLAVTVNAIADGGKNYEEKALIKVSVTYANNSKDSASFNEFDWQVQDANGARESAAFTEADSLGSGDLAPGGTKSGDLFFLAEGASKIVYESNFFGGEDDLAMWNVN